MKRIECTLTKEMTEMLKALKGKVLKTYTGLLTPRTGTVVVTDRELYFCIGKGHYYLFNVMHPVAFSESPDGIADFTYLTLRKSEFAMAEGTYMHSADFTWQMIDEKVKQVRVIQDDICPRGKDYVVSFDTGIVLFCEHHTYSFVRADIRGTKLKIGTDTDVEALCGEELPGEQWQRLYGTEADVVRHIHTA